MVDQAEIHRMARSEDVEERMKAVEELKDNFVNLKDKKQAWNDLIKFMHDKIFDVRRRAADAIGTVYSYIPEQHKNEAWDDLHKLTLDEYSELKGSAADAIGRAFAHVPDKQQVWQDIHRLVWDKDSEVRSKAGNTIGVTFAYVPNKQKAWQDLHRLALDKDSKVRKSAASAIGVAFSYVSDRQEAWQDIHRLAQDNDSEVRWNTVYAISVAFMHIPDKQQAWEDIHKLTQDENNNVRMSVSSVIGKTFPYVQDKQQAQDDLHWLARDNDMWVRWNTIYAIEAAFMHVPDKQQSWRDMQMFTHDENSYMRRNAADVIGATFMHLPNQDRAWEDLHKLTQDENSDVRIFANYSLGKVDILRACESGEEDFRKEIEKAIEFFEKASKESTFINPAKFCLPFYRSFYTLTFKNEETEAEVQKYIAEAKSAVAGSGSKKKLLEAIENLGNALKEVHKARDFSAVKADLNAYRRYCDRACELLDTTEEKAPGASRLIRKGLPIIDERIKGIIAEIQEKAKALCKQVKDTEYKEIGQQANEIGQKLLKIRDPIGLEKGINNLLIPLSAICKKMPEEDKGEACEILKKINDEQYIEDKLPLISMFLSKISTQMDQKNVYVSIEKSKYVQVSIGNGNYQVQSSDSRHEKV